MARTKTMSKPRPKTTARVPGNLFFSFAPPVRLFSHDVLRHPQDQEVALAGLFFRGQLDLGKLDGLDM
jgi:hypothetical protein